MRTLGWEGACGPNASLTHRGPRLVPSSTLRTQPLPPGQPPGRGRLCHPCPGPDAPSPRPVRPAVDMPRVTAPRPDLGHPTARLSCPAWRPEPQSPPRPACLHLRAPTGGAEMQRPGEPGRAPGPGLGRPVCEPSGGLGVPEAVAPVGDSEGGSPSEGSPVPGYPGGPEGSGKCAPFHREPPQGKAGV